MKKKPSKSVILIIAVIILAVAVVNEFARYHTQKENATGANAQYATVTLFPQNAKPLAIRAEVAATDEKRTTGLMFRKSLGKDEGMLFVFPAASIETFWMKNTLIPLDIIFIAENNTIVRIHHAVPCTSDPCQIYSSEKPIKYVVEVNGNFTIDHAVKEYGQVTIKN